MTSTPIILPRILRSPTTAQYRIPSGPLGKFYEPRFILDRTEKTLVKQSTWFQTTDPMMPPYPYGKNTRYPEANDGLYGGQTIQTGNKISQGRNKGKTLRKWYPNVRVERIRSEALDQELTIPISARVMRTIKKVGGLDQYVTGTKPARIKELGLLGWKLRWMVVNSETWRAKYAAERAAAGFVALPAENAEEIVLDRSFEQAWADEETRRELVEKQEKKWEKLREKDERFKKHFMQNIVADWSDIKVPELSTLSIYDPQALLLEHVVVKEGGEGRYKDSANDVR